ncbi:hypothetical protein ACFXJ8_43790 [Nonomuraea sp. NPDC059194]|uniref:hypothetical protein n=1 Tax=Nonomuraea sp. NPDC059194 TaxID=3346764 RepID=UPI0036D051CD
MRKMLALVAGAVAIVGVLVALPSTASGNAQWHLGEQSSSLEFNAQVVPIGKNQVWAFGTRRFWEWSLGPTATRWDGERWHEQEVPGGFGTSVTAAAASSDTNVWLATHSQAGQVVSRWDGNGWTAMRRMESSAVADIAVLGEDDVWLFGEQTWHYTGSTWARADLPMDVRRVSARSPRDIWVIGWDPLLDKPTAGHFDGTGWSTSPIDHPGDHVFPDGVSADASGVWITATVSDDVAQTSTPILLRRTGTGWQQEPVEQVVGPWRETFNPIPDGRGGHWFLGSTDVNSYDSTLAHRSADGVWTQTPVHPSPGTAEFSTLAGVPGTGQLFATGSLDGTPGIYLHRLP